MFELFTLGALAGAFFYLSATPKAGRRAQSKMDWGDAVTVVLCVMALTWLN